MWQRWVSWSVLFPFPQHLLLVPLGRRIPGWLIIASFILLYFYLLLQIRLWNYFCLTSKGIHWVFMFPKNSSEFTGRSIDKMLNFKVSGPQFSCALTKQVLSLTYMCPLNSKRSHSALLNRNGIICMPSDKVAELKPHCRVFVGSYIFPLRNGEKKPLCDLYVHSENLKIGFYLLVSHLE